MISVVLSFVGGCGLHLGGLGGPGLCGLGGLDLGGLDLGGLGLCGLGLCGLDLSVGVGPSPLDSPYAGPFTVC
jgi:hypothetical protein